VATLVCIVLPVAAPPLAVALELEGVPAGAVLSSVALQASIAAQIDAAIFVRVKTRSITR
jgi:hypothetical protein